MKQLEELLHIQFLASSDVSNELQLSGLRHLL